jgi:hypothetical protein
MAMVMKNLNTARSRFLSLGALALPAFLLASAGCGPGLLHTAELTPAERQVRIIEQEKGPPCTLYEERGTIEAESSLAPRGSFESTQNRLRRTAAERGASLVLLQAHSTRNGVDYARGLAIRCLPRPEVAPPPSPPSEAPSATPAAPAPAPSTAPAASPAPAP